MPTLHIIEGPVGAGKTTYAHKLANEVGYPPFVLDGWMANLFQQDRPETDLWTWYAARKARCMEQIMQLALGALDHGRDAIVELGLIKAADRMKLYADLERTNHSYLVHIVDAPRSIRRQRVRHRNTERSTTFAMHVSEEVFEMTSDMWEPVSAVEQQGRCERFCVIAPQ